ncbi:MAG: HAMP domain-containing histidine kinase [Lentisphaeraceae bacterium]|nr:HAMP domain-containing histidine kinase [Lentisphaeraceae bacterium]
MNSLKKALLFRFFLILAFHTLLTLVAVYGITLWNVNKSKKRELKKFEERLVKTLTDQIKLDKKNYILTLDVDEESEFSFVAKFKDGSFIEAGKRSEQLFDSFELSENGFEFESYKSFSRISSYEDDELKVKSQIRVSLDLIDDTFWVFAFSFPILLIPAVLFSRGLFGSVVKPLGEVSRVLTKVDLGERSERVNIASHYTEINSFITSLNKTLEQTDHLFSRVENFNAHAAHELKTPLTIIKGELELLLDQKSDDSEVTLEKILTEVDYLLGVLNSLLMISSSGNSFKESFEKLNLSESLRETCELINVLAVDKSINLDLEISDVEFVGSEKLLRQAFFNLIENAIKFSPKKSTIIVRLSTKDTGFTFSVSDKGKALSAVEQKKIFEPFLRLSQEEVGSGLGLAMVKWICQIHDLSIYVKSSETGNEFLIKT